MEKKRSKGVTILSSLLILICLYVFVMTAVRFRMMVYYLTEVYALPLRVITLVTYLLYIGAFISGILTLQLKEVGRKLIIALSILYIAHYFIGLYFYTEMSPVGLPRIVLDNLSALLYIYFFTRPKVKEQFR